MKQVEQTAGTGGESPLGDEGRGPRPALPGTDAGQLEEHHEASFAWALSCCGWGRARADDVLQLVFYHDLTIAEAAGVLHIALGTARRHYERGKGALRQALEGRIGSPAPGTYATCRLLVGGPARWHRRLAP